MLKARLVRQPAGLFRAWPRQLRKAKLQSTRVLE
jgi:hypothetical protein